MTKNQIEYQRSLETQRANLANEALTRERDAETARANKERERLQAQANSNQVSIAGMQNRLGYDQLREASRHNITVEGETGRSNRASEAIQYTRIGEEKRHNIAFETETSRHNISAESENVRSNMAREHETNRHNVESEDVARKQMASGVISSITRGAKDLADAFGFADRMFKGGK